MPRPKFKTLIIMPYLPLEGVIKFSGLKLWSFQKNLDQFVKDEPLKEHLKKLTGCYQFYRGHVLQNPTIISVGKADFSNPSRRTIAKIEALKNILLLASVLENNSWSFTTSDNFEVFYQRFNVGDDNISTSGGSIHRILAGGYKLGEIAFTKPEHINIPLKFGAKGSIIRALEDCLTNSSTIPAKSQVIQSLNPFFNAYRNSHEHSPQSRILLMIMAFELLFGETGRPQFRTNIQRYSTLSSPLTMPTHNYPIVNYGRVTSNEQLTLNQIWAEEFYKLRHKIIHGDSVYSDDFIFKDLLSLVSPREPYFSIAVNFFVVCVINKLRDLGFTNVPRLVINPNARAGLFTKNISGIKNETFKLEEIVTL